MKKKQWKQPKYRLLKAGCVGAGLLSISNPTQVTAADIGIYDLHNDAPIGVVANPFPNSPMGVHVAAGDLDGDGRADIIIGPGRGDNEYAIADSESFFYQKIPWDYYPQKTGVRVAAGDVNGDGTADVILSPSTGRHSPVEYVKIRFPPGAAAEVETIEQFDDVIDGFSGGVNVATGDIDGDGGPDDVLAGRLSCACGRPIRKWPTLSGIAGFEDFGPPVPSGQGGVQVAVGDLDGDGKDDVLVLPVDPPSGMSQPLIAASKSKHKNWITLDSFSEPAGVHIALGDLENDGIPDLVVGSARGSDPTVSFYTLEENPALGTFMASKKIGFIVEGRGFNGGVRVAVGDVNGDGFADLAYAPAGIPEPATITSLLAGLGTFLLGGRRRRRDDSPPG